MLEVRSVLERTPPWLTVAGNYLGDIGVAGLLAGAEAAAKRLARVDPRSTLSQAESLVSLKTFALRTPHPDRAAIVLLL